MVGGMGATVTHVPASRGPRQCEVGHVQLLCVDAQCCSPWSTAQHHAFCGSRTPWLCLQHTF